MPVKTFERLPFTLEELIQHSIKELYRKRGRELDKLRALELIADAPKPEPVAAHTMALAYAEVQKKHVGRCPEHYLHGSDDNGHNFAKELLCGREWCPVCGKKNSKAHLRRFSRWLPKAQQLSKIGYFVIEWPLSSRSKLRKRRELEAAGKLAYKVLSGNYEIEQRRKSSMVTNSEAYLIKQKWFSRGLRRWHYFGDTKKELKNIGLTWQTPAPDELPDGELRTNIHLNALVPHGYIPKPFFKHIVKSLRIAFNEPQLIVHYGYTKKPGKMVHLLKYVTRATFLDINWDEALAGQLYGFRNMRCWGVWRDKELWALSDLRGAAADEVAGLDIKAINSLRESRCYIDGLRIKWSKPRPIAELRDVPLKLELGAGYYRLPDVKPVASIKESFRMMLQRVLADRERKERYDDILGREYALIRDYAECWDMLEALHDEHYTSLEYEIKRVALYCGTQTPLALGSDEDAPWGGVAT
jgi:hypothetical protein